MEPTRRTTSRGDLHEDNLAAIQADRERMERYREKAGLSPTPAPPIPFTPAPLPIQSTPTPTPTTDSDSITSANAEALSYHYPTPCEILRHVYTFQPGETCCKTASRIALWILSILSCGLLTLGLFTYINICCCLNK